MSEKTRILIAEDDRLGAESLRKSLELLGYEVTDIVSIGEEVFDRAFMQRPDLIVMDVTLSGSVDGIRAVERVHTMADIPVIYLTAHKDEKIFARAKATGPYAFLNKPYEITQLAHAIEIAVTKHQLEKRVHESENRYRTIFEVSDNAMMLIDADGTVLMINREFERLTGFYRENVEQLKSWTEFLMGDDQVKVEKLQHHEVPEGATRDTRFEASLIDSKGSPITVYTNVRIIPETLTYVISMSDIRELKKANDEINQLNRELSKVNAELIQEIGERKKYEKQLQHQANHDPLTGLPNRVLLFELMKQSCAFEDRHNKLLALMLLDLDNFKHINDSMGHLSGDILLKKVAKRLQSCMRQYDTVGRLGGDEFVIVANDISTVNDIVRFSEKLLAAFQQPFDILGQNVIVTASIGIAIYPVHGVTVKSLMKMADSAMYNAKKAGRNMFRFFSDEAGSEGGKKPASISGSRDETSRRLQRSDFTIRSTPIFSDKDKPRETH